VGWDKNIAVVDFYYNGNKLNLGRENVFVSNLTGKGHSEQQIINALRNHFKANNLPESEMMNVVGTIFSEYHPCGVGSQNCAGLLRKHLNLSTTASTGVRVDWSFAYPAVGSNKAAWEAFMNNPDYGPRTMHQLLTSLARTNPTELKGYQVFAENVAKQQAPLMIGKPNNIP